jgi:acyl carrier protein
MQKIHDAAELLELLREVAAELQLDVAVIDPETTLQELNLDSLDQLELLTALEDRTGYRIPDEKIGEIKTIRDIIDCLLDLQR